MAFVSSMCARLAEAFARRRADRQSTLLAIAASKAAAERGHVFHFESKE